MPPEGSTITFQHWFKSSFCPFAIYADTEALCRKHITCKIDPSRVGTTKLEDRIPCSFGAVLVDRTTNSTTYKTDRGPDCIKNFFDWIRLPAKNLSHAKQKHKQLDISKTERDILYSSTSQCVICHKDLLNDKVVHHDHATGKVFGLAHNKCNLKLRVQAFTPVFFHNLSKYDSHHLIENFTLAGGEKITVVPCTDENYISFSLHVPVGSYMDKKGVEKNKVRRNEVLRQFSVSS